MDKDKKEYLDAMGEALNAFARLGAACAGAKALRRAAALLASGAVSAKAAKMIAQVGTGSALPAQLEEAEKSLRECAEAAALFRATLLRVASGN